MYEYLSLPFFWVVKLALVPVLIFHEDPFEKASLSQLAQVTDKKEIISTPNMQQQSPEKILKL